MKCKVCLAMAVFVAGMLVMADFTDDFQEALKLYNNGKSIESLERFEGLVKTAPTPGSKADSLQYAVMSAIKVKQYEKATELINQISRESTKKLCQMNLMLAQGQTQELVNASNDEDFTKWSDSHIYDALVTRGQAYRLLKQYAEAIKDFKKAEELALTSEKKVQILSLIGGTWQEAGDDEQALAVWRRMEEIPHMKGRGIIKDAIINAARILAKQQKYDEALKEMAKIEPESEGWWHARPLTVIAEIYTAQGKKEEAVSKYNEALQGAPEDLKKSIQAAIGKLK